MKTTPETICKPEDSAFDPTNDAHVLEYQKGLVCEDDEPTMCLLCGWDANFLGITDPEFMKTARAQLITHQQEAH
tara:strand:- start:1159 stop:1383 length:225 start_codon:yes stop_codon:yes gene_type:complete